MSVLQISVPKSGSLWLYRILENIVRYGGGLERKSFIQNQPIYRLAKTWNSSFAGQAGVDFLDIYQHSCFYAFWPVFSEPIEDIDDYIHQCSIVWTHSTFCERSLTVLPKFDKVVYIIRDPRDMALSMSKYVSIPYMKKYFPHDYSDPKEYLADQLEALIRDWVRHVGGYLKHKDDLKIHIVFYERLLHAFDTEFTALLAYLGVDLDENTITRIRHDVDFTMMKKENPDHVRKGKSGEWRQILTATQQKRVAQIAGPMLKLLNYPLDESITLENQVGQSLPCLPTQLGRGQIEKAIISSQESSLRRYIKRGWAFATSAKPFGEKVRRIYMFLTG